jgi:hypothetical protein
MVLLTKTDLQGAMCEEDIRDIFEFPQVKIEDEQVYFPIKFF